jgi:hypothetical protein
LSEVGGVPKEAVEQLFADELQSGRVQWQVVNFDEAWNAHFITDYDLGFQSLVLVDVRGGKDARYSNLLKIWELVGDKQAYFEYVRTEIEAYLTGS